VEHVVYTQVYLSNMSSSDTMDRIWREFFPKQPPARAVLGVHRMHTDTPVVAERVHAVLSRERSPPTTEMPRPSLASI